ncbi:hypothetical protein VNI00_015611, partial [Paramarasmius palmivorus]
KEPLSLIASSSVVSITAQSGSTAPNRGVIAGSVVGALVFVFIASILVWMHWKRTKTSHDRVSFGIESSISPYPNIWSTSASPRKVKSNNRDRGFIDTDVHHQLRVLSEHSTTAGTSNSGAEVFDGRVLYHEDSGWRPSPHEGRVREVPPRYESAL